jgi:hypothetical protein
MSALLRCILPTAACSWSPHRYKHFPLQRMTRQHTVGRGNPARYLSHVQIRLLETETVQIAPRQVTQTALATYIRDMGVVIGWADGQDATVSYVECSGGTTAGRSYHGRPTQ